MTDRRKDQILCQSLEQILNHLSSALREHIDDVPNEDLRDISTLFRQVDQFVPSLVLQ